MKQKKKQTKYDLKYQNNILEDSDKQKKKQFQSNFVTNHFRNIISPTPKCTIYWHLCVDLVHKQCV